MSAVGPDRRTHVRIEAAVGVSLLMLGELLTIVHARPLSDSWYLVCWLGFIAFGDALLAWRTGASLFFDRRREGFVMFATSAALWWCFELANALHLGSWSYSPSPDVPRWAQALRSTLAFATLIPATWMAGLVALSVKTTVAPHAREVDFRNLRAWALVSMVFGGGLVALALFIQRLALPLGLAGMIALVDPLNHLRDRPSLMAMIAQRDFRVPAALFFGSVAAGFLGEAWNYPADPRWTYDVEFPAGPKVFAMPLAGYLGYGALAWALFALHHAVRPRTCRAEQKDALAPAHPLIVTGL